MKYLFIPLLALLISAVSLTAQSSDSLMVRDLTIQTSLGSFSRSGNSIAIDNKNYTWFYYNNIDEIALIDLLIPGYRPSDSLYSVLPSGDYSVIGPPASAGKDIVRLKIRFSNLSHNNFLQLNLQQKLEDTVKNMAFPLLPLTRTSANFFPQSAELFLGEEKIYEIVSDNPGNISVSTEWIHTGGFDYRIDRKFDMVNLHVVPKSLGAQKLDVILKTNNPHIDARGKLSYEVHVGQKNFTILRSRLAFLESYTREVEFTQENRKAGIDIQLDDSPRLKTGTTYRIEDQEEPGGALIAELFTRSRLSNNRILCLLRVYNLHNSADGYLYIKEGDEAINMTNFSISPEMKINGIEIMREGDNWSRDPVIYPGDVVEIKVEGQGLLKSSFVWNNAIDLTTDSTLRTDNVAFFRIKIPVNVNTRRIALFNKGEDTGRGLDIKEFQEPRNFDFITVNYGTGDKVITRLGGPVVHKKVIKDILIDFDANKIDSESKIYGKQYIEVEVRITGKNRELIELKTIPVFAVCPGELSPRHEYYYKKDCISTGISLNKYLSRKTYDLDDWVRIELTFRHDNSKYETRGMVQNTEFIVQKDYQFDIDVSFPAGLIIKTFNDEAGAFDNFGGISMAMMAQFSFYDPERIGKFKPYKVGAGFLALNAFNFNENVSRDVAFVILGSLYPTRKDVKLTFPLYMGGGVWLGTGKPFVVLGPGIRVSL